MTGLKWMGGAILPTITCLVVLLFLYVYGGTQSLDEHSHPELKKLIVDDVNTALGVEASRNRDKFAEIERQFQDSQTNFIDLEIFYLEIEDQINANFRTVDERMQFLFEIVR